ncbi:MAG: biotin/lipoyl-binding protein [Acholeplasmatales bacterium]|nr:biotin/lipoyl-binding protein [Acholeplasmatales bacterium]
MNLEEIEKLMKLLENSSLSYLEVEENGLKIKLDKNSGTRETVVTKSEKEEGVSNLAPTLEETGNAVTAPLVGTFHQAPYKDAKPFVSVGSKVKKGDKLCIIEAMKVMNEITSPFDGVVKEILVKDNDVVDFGKKLFVIGD